MDKRMNKYSNKIMRFLDDKFEHEHKMYDFVNPDGNLITEIHDKFSQLEPVKLEHKTSRLRKLHFYNEPSVILLILQKLHQDEKLPDCDAKTDSELIEWYRVNHAKIDIKEKINKYKKDNKKIHQCEKDDHRFMCDITMENIYDILFKPIDNRIELHSLLYGSTFVSLDVIHHAESENLIYDHYVGDLYDIHVYSPDNEISHQINLDWCVK